MPERAPPLRDVPPLNPTYRALSTEQLLERAQESADQVRSGRRSTALYRAQKLWGSRTELFAYSALAEPDPYPEPVVGSEVLNALVTVLRTYSELDEAGAQAVALWIAHCWCIEWSDISPRLAITGPTSSVGRSGLLRLIACLVPRPLVLARANLNPLLQLIDAVHPTLVLDDADRWVFTGRDICDAVAAGHACDAAYLNPERGAFQPLAHSCFTPCAYSFRGKAPLQLMRRSIVVALSPPRANDRRQMTDALPPEADCDRLKAQVVRWLRDTAGSFSHQIAALPAISVTERRNWQPLLSIAQAAGNAWSEHAAAAALKLADGSCRDIGVELLRDVQSKLASVDRITSADLVAALLEDEERPWGRMAGGRKLDVRSLASALAPFGIRPRVMRLQDTFARGYYLQDFAEAFSRHLEPTSVGERA